MKERVEILNYRGTIETEKTDGGGYAAALKIPFPDEGGALIAVRQLAAHFDITLKEEDSHLPRVPTETELAEAMSRPPVYKAVRVSEAYEGKLTSLWVRGTVDKPWRMTEVLGVAITRTYSTDMLTHGGKRGIFCNVSLSAAIEQMHANGKGHEAQVYEAFPIGDVLPNVPGFSTNETVIYPAIILGKRVLASKDSEDVVTEHTQPKEISEELAGRNAAICITCGAIFDNIDSIFAPCPECGESDNSGGLRYISPAHSWRDSRILGYHIED